MAVVRQWRRDSHIGPAAWRPFNAKLLDGFNFEKGGGLPYSADKHFHRVMAEESSQTVVAKLFDLILQTNVRGAFATVRAFRTLLAADGGGLIVNVSSLAARMAGGSMNPWRKQSTSWRRP